MILIIMFVYQRKRVCTLIVVWFLDGELFVPANLSTSILHHELLGFIHFRVELLWLWRIQSSLDIRFVGFLDIACSVLSRSIDFSIVIKVVVQQIIRFSFQWVRSSFWRRVTETWGIIRLSERIIERWVFSQMLHDVSFFAYLNSYARIVGCWSSRFISSTLLLLDVLFALEVWRTEIVLPSIYFFVLLPICLIFQYWQVLRFLLISHRFLVHLILKLDHVFVQDFLIYILIEVCHLTQISRYFR